MTDEANTGAPEAGRSLARLVGATATSITALVGVFVTVNTGITTVAAQRALRHEAFQKAVAAEEIYWRNLYNDYLQTFSAESNGNLELKRGKQFTIANFASRPVPTFAEFSVEEKEKIAARKRFEDLQKNLTEVLRQPESSGEVAKSLQAQDFEKDQASIPVRGDGGASGASAPVVATINYDTQVISDRNGQGWDIDVIWCRGAGEGARYGTALAAARTLADVAKGDRKLWKGNLIGRVRLRSLPEGLRDQPGMAGRSDAVVYDSGPAEREVAAAVAAKLGAPPVGRFTTTQLSETSTTRWYLSVFVCA